MNFGFVNIAAVNFDIKIADCHYNAKNALKACEAAYNNGAQIICMPELCITGYTCGDLLFQNTLQDSMIKALLMFARNTKELNALIFIGMPFLLNGTLYNCAFVLNKGKIIAAIPKTYLPNYNEFYEMRHFSTYKGKSNITVKLNQHEFIFGTKLLFEAANMSELKIAAEICEDLWAPLSPAIHHSSAGANVIVNLSASNEIVGKANYRRKLVSMQSAKLFCAYLYCSANYSESTTDMVLSGHNIIAENGEILNESRLFNASSTHAQIDVQRLNNERVKTACNNEKNTDGYQTIIFNMCEGNENLTRYYSPTPFVPNDENELDNRCEEILNIQAFGLAKRLQHINCKTSVIGISGGLDSCLALLVAHRAHKIANMPLKDILAVTMPGFGTTNKTKNNAVLLCNALGVSLKEIDIKNTSISNFNDIGHDENTYDTVYENVQARVRTLVLMNLANSTNGIVIGTGDLSELALGFATYNGDHMSMYGVNGSVPKTLVRHLVKYTAKTCENTTLAQVLNDILNTPVSPELLPAINGEISQKTEHIVGPYELHDFFLYYLVRHSFSPNKIYFLAQHAFNGIYENEIILKYLKLFIKRFFTQQFKRNCIPDGPKVGSVTLSPRADWRMPSDACANAWLAELENM